MNRVVVFQGQYGVFPTRGLSLSMPAVQTCIGVFGIHDSGQTLVAAHFDTDQMLEANIGEIEKKMPRGHQWRDYDVTIFGGDGAAQGAVGTDEEQFHGDSFVAVSRQSAEWRQSAPAYPP